MTRLALIALPLLLASAGQTPQPKPPAPPNPSVVAAPAWSRTLPMPDGRTFVTDGGLAVDAALAKPASMPTTALSVENGKVFERRLTGTFVDEIGLGELRAGPYPNTFAGPRGIAVNGNYVTFLRRTIPQSRLRFNTALDPIVIVVANRPVGVLMPVATPR